LLISPFYLRDNVIKMINQEIKNAKAGKEAWMLIKLNNLVDEKVVKKLYQASQAGVKIDMIVRGICILVPGIKGLSENIKVISIVDRFLEHSRVYIFAHGGSPKYYISSADWMIRNFDHRFEAATPVYDPALQKELMEMLQMQLRDNVKARLVNSQPVNQYQKTESKEKLRSQFAIYDYLKKKGISLKPFYPEMG
jgi:polyphosphate kinase